MCKTTIKAFKVSFDRDKHEVTVNQAVEAVKEFNKEFSRGKTDADLISEMLKNPIYTNCARYWIEVVSDETAELRDVLVKVHKHLMDVGCPAEIGRAVQAVLYE